MPSLSSCKFFGLYVECKYCFIEPHTFSMRFKSGLCWRRPPIDIMLFEEVLNVMAGMFGIIILLKSVSSRIMIPNEGKQASFQHLGYSSGIHNTRKHYDLGGTFE